MLAEQDEYTPTPAVSHAILTYNRGRTTGLADGIVITPSHNPPDDGGFKYNPPNGGPAEPTSPAGSRRRPTSFSSWPAGREADAVREGAARRHDAPARLSQRLHERPRQRDRHGRHSRRAASAWASIRWAARASTTGAPIAERYGLDLTVVNEAVDPTFRFMTVDWDGQIRMDPSSPYAMQRLIG